VHAPPTPLGRLPARRRLTGIYSCRFIIIWTGLIGGSESPACRSQISPLCTPNWSQHEQRQPGAQGPLLLLFPALPPFTSASSRPSQAHPAACPASVPEENFGPSELPCVSVDPWLRDCRGCGGCRACGSPGAAASRGQPSPPHKRAHCERMLALPQHTAAAARLRGHVSPGTAGRVALWLLRYCRGACSLTPLQHHATALPPPCAPALRIPIALVLCALLRHMLTADCLTAAGTGSTVPLGGAAALGSSGSSWPPAGQTCRL
jgi:hypothetical protein